MVELISDKEIKKSNEELLSLHKRCLLNYLIQEDLSLRNRKRFFKLYDHYISHRNIREYFSKPLKLFVYALVTDKLEEIGNFKKYSKKALRKSKRGKNKRYV